MCYFDPNADLHHKFERLDNCIQFVLNLRKYDHISQHRFNLNWFSIRIRKQRRALTNLYSILFSPIFLSYLTTQLQYLVIN